MSKVDRLTPSTQNIERVADLEKKFLEGRTTVEKVGDLIGSFAGSMKFIVLHIVVFTLWFTINNHKIPGIPAFDPFPYMFLNMAVSLEAVLLSTFVLMKQNSMSRRSEQRDHLTLQIDMLTEQETTKNLQLLRLICDRLGIKDAHLDPEVTELATDTAVHQIAEELSEKLSEE
jgi:uncharacterized membrane protein